MINAAGMGRLPFRAETGLNFLIMEADPVAMPSCAYIHGMRDKQGS